VTTFTTTRHEVARPIGSESDPGWS